MSRKELAAVARELASKLHARPFGDVIAEKMRAFREEDGERQDEVAARARQYGLRWTQATVAAIETGRRELRLEEFLILPYITGRQVPDLFEPDELVLVGEAVASTANIKQVLAGTAGGGDDLKGTASRAREAVRVIAAPDAFYAAARELLPLSSTDESLDVLREAEQEVERRAARRLGVDPRYLALAARHRWGRSLTAERDRRSPEGITSRGHITRALIGELRPTLEEAQLIDPPSRED